MVVACRQMFVACVAVAAELLVGACVAVAAVRRLLFVVRDLGGIERVSGVECVDEAAVELGGVEPFPSVASFQRSSDP